ncbi:MAG: hypothetical protein E7467_06685 [Ruminococcaceae bacterium]|nr:hypothetical protein [Oscillospiraceae bacterium]
MHIDEKFKDNSPVKTVQNIQQLLAKYGFEVTEKWYDTGIEHCHSVSIFINGTKLSTHGKGVTKELARASGYAEMMERLQSGYRGVGGLRFPDFREMTKDEIWQENAAYYAQIAEKMGENEAQKFTAEEILDFSVTNRENDTCRAIAYLDVFTGKKVYLPYMLLRNIYGTNGLAAGNSTEEAIVQGMSEIVERYCQRFFLEGKLTPPDVPEEYLAQFETAYAVIRQIREEGFDLIVKDCSLGEGYPVVASIVMDRKTKACRVMFGASPVFEIALERSLTEVFQGCAIKALPMVRGFFIGKKRSRYDMEAAFVVGNSNYPLEFFAYEASYLFQPFEDRSSLNNKALLSYILTYLKQKNRTMLVRDLSHMGFHTYRIIVPGMSEIDTYVFTGKPSYYELSLKLAKRRSDLSVATQEELLAYQQLFDTVPATSEQVPELNALARIPLDVDARQSRFLSLMSVAYACWQTGRKEKAGEYVQKAQQLAPAQLQAYMESLSHMLLLHLNGYSFDDCARLMYRFFDPMLVESARQSCLRGNPFADFLIKCDRNCSACGYARICMYQANKSVTDRVNAAVAEFDNDAAFENLKACIAALT